MIDTATRRSSVLVSMVTCASLALSGAVAAQADPASVTPVRRGDGGQTRPRTTLEGFVLAPDGSPAEGAVVVSSAGGKAVTDFAGSYRLEVEVPPDATSVQLTAVSSAGRSLVASASVALSA